MKIVNYFKNLLSSPTFRLGLLVTLAILAGIQALFQDEIANFIIFKTAAQRLLHHENVYDTIQYSIIWDKFFYSPPFAMLFIPFSLIPTAVSIFLWLLLGALLFYVALQKFPITASQKTIVFCISLIDLVNSFQNLQTNALNTALMLFIFICLSTDRPMWAALCITICLSIKIYPAAVGLLFVFYPNKIKFLVWCALFTALLFVLPLLLLPKDYYFSSLQNWVITVSEDANDKTIYNSPSLVGINYSWFSRPINHFYIELTGLFLVFVPLLKLLKKQIDANFILLYLAFIMLFVIVFNHAAESATFVIAVTGAAIWYAVSPKSKVNQVLLVLLFVACILTPTDIYPEWIRKEYFMPLKIRVVPCILIWVKLFYELLSYKPQQAPVTA
jgi:hypothetical protein